MNISLWPIFSVLDNRRKVGGGCTHLGVRTRRDIHRARFTGHQFDTPHVGAVIYSTFSITPEPPQPHSILPLLSPPSPHVSKKKTVFKCKVWCCCLSNCFYDFRSKNVWVFFFNFSIIEYIILYRMFQWEFEILWIHPREQENWCLNYFKTLFFCLWVFWIFRKSFLWIEF